MAKKSKTKRPNKIIDRNGVGTMRDVPSSTQRAPNPVAKRNPILWKKEMVDSGHGYKVAKWTRRASPKKALPLDKSKKKGSPRSYENLKKSKPVGKGKKGKGPS